MLKKVVLGLVCGLLLLCPGVCCPGQASAAEIRDLYPDTSDLDQFLDQMDQDASQWMDGLSLASIWGQMRSGDMELNPGALLRKILEVLLKQIFFQMRWFGQILVIAVVCLIMEQLGGAFEGNGAAKAASVVCLILIMTLSVKGFNESMTGGRAAINRMGEFMEFLMPVMLSLLLAMGHGTTVLLTRPVLIGSLSMMTALISHVIFPMIFLGLALGLVDHLSEDHKITKLVQFIRSGVKWGIGLTMTVFVAVLSIQGGLGSVSDGVLLRTAKYVTGAALPVAGGLFADAVDAVVGTSLVFKNTLGFFGIIGILLTAFGPLAGMFAQAVLFRLGGALIQPFGERLAGNMLDEMADAMMLIFTATAAVAVMFFLTLALMLLAANATIMLR
ncbi:MAG: stage III sporulation protein AE [Peptococcaceae bacterium]|nr:stage III sporulation protein AE [Peptococcaceae bacterium]